MALRILAAWYISLDLLSSHLSTHSYSRYLVGQDSGFPAVNVNVWNLNAPVNTHVNVQGDHKT